MRTSSRLRDKTSAQAIISKGTAVIAGEKRKMAVQTQNESSMFDDKENKFALSSAKKPKLAP